MSQNSITIDNGTGLAVRTAINNALDSLSTVFSGSSAPTSPTIYSSWVDTSVSPNMLKIYDGVQFIEVAEVDVSAHTYTLLISAGGTGAITSTDARANLDVYSKSEVDAIATGETAFGGYALSGASTPIEDPDAALSLDFDDITKNGIWLALSTYANGPLALDSVVTVIRGDAGNVIQYAVPSLTSATAAQARQTWQRYTTDNGVTWSAWVVISDDIFGLNKIAIIRDVKASGVNGGDSILGVQVRDLNDVYDPHGLVSLSANIIEILDDGDYLFDWSCTANQVNGHQSQLYNNTTSSVAIVGDSMIVSSTVISVNTQSNGSGVLSCSAGDTYSLRHYTGRNAVPGLGFPSGSGEVEVYSTLKITKRS